MFVFPIHSLDEVHALGALHAVCVVDHVGDGGGAVGAWAVEELGERGEVVGRPGREARRRRQHAHNVVLEERWLQSTPDNCVRYSHFE